MPDIEGALPLQVLRLQSGFLRDLCQKARTNLSAVVKGECVVGPPRTLENDDGSHSVNRRSIQCGATRPNSRLALTYNSSRLASGTSLLLGLTKRIVDAAAIL